MNPNSVHLERSSIPRGLQFALFLTAMAWVGAAHSIATRTASGISTRFFLPGLEPSLQALFLIFLAVLGFAALDRIATRGTETLDVLPLPGRVGRAREWGSGAAIGWGVCLLAVLPALLSGHLHGRFLPGASRPMAIFSSLLTILIAALAEEAIFRGYPMQRLTRAVGPTWAALLLSAGFAFYLVTGNVTRHLVLAFISSLLFGLLLSMAYFRTHGLWLGWGVHFGYRAVMAVVLGLPIAGFGASGTIVDSYVWGPRWLSGGAFGLDAALFTSVAMLLGMAVLYRVSTDWAWSYTHTPIVAAGYEVTIAPPAAHVAMEKAAAPPPLVQILPSTPAGPYAASPDEFVKK